MEEDNPSSWGIFLSLGLPHSSSPPPPSPEFQSFPVQYIPFMQPQRQVHNFLPSQDQHQPQEAVAPVQVLRPSHPPHSSSPPPPSSEFQPFPVQYIPFMQPQQQVHNFLPSQEQQPQDQRQHQHQPQEAVAPVQVLRPNHPPHSSSPPPPPSSEFQPFPVQYIPFMQPQQVHNFLPSQEQQPQDQHQHQHQPQEAVAPVQVLRPNHPPHSLSLPPPSFKFQPFPVQYIPFMQPQQQVHNFLPSQEQQPQDQHQHQPQEAIAPVQVLCPNHPPHSSSPPPPSSEFQPFPVQYIPFMQPQQQVHNFLPSQEQQPQDQHQPQEAVAPVQVLRPNHPPHSSSSPPPSSEFQPFPVQYIPFMQPQQQVHNFLPSQEQQPQDQHQHQPQEAVAPVQVLRPSHPPRDLPARPVMREVEPGIIPAPFPWATTKRATVHMLDHLLSQGLTTIIGEVRCKGCGVQRNIQFDLVEKFQKVYSYVANNICDMNDRAPNHWEQPVLPTCEGCGRENSLRPILSHEINWLFLFLGELIGCCTIEQLKYFCKHTNNHMTGAKDRLVYQTYVTLCKQLQPNGAF